MKNNKIYYATFSIALIVGLMLTVFVFSQWQTIHQNFEYQSNSEEGNKTIQGLITPEEKQKGAHVFGIVDTTDFQELTKTNLEWITLVSWGFQDNCESPNVTHHNGDSLRMLEHDAHWIRKIELVRSAGFKVFFKPHLWVESPADGKWRSDIFPTSDENWETWKKTYRDFIIRYAKVAEQANAEMFCIGTEFTRLTLEKPEFWKDLIQEIRSVYSGKITYAANWYQEFEKMTFWNELDYIGIQAYFPLTRHKYPNVKQISKGWKKHLRAIEYTHKKFNKKVLFTEMGYKSTANCAIKPWEWIENASHEDNPFSPETQANCYKSFFDMVWEKEWFAGVHIWQLRVNLRKNRAYDNLDFTPQGKLAESVITKGFE